MLTIGLSFSLACGILVYCLIYDERIRNVIGVTPTKSLIFVFAVLSLIGFGAAVNDVIEVINLPRY